MTSNRRIAINFIATYGRSLFALVCGLFSGRWALQALGEVDYGLFGVVGGLTAFLAFFNNLMGGAVSRYYGYSVGASINTGLDGLEDCRRWFTTAIMIHSVLSVLMVATGYPVGVWAIEKFLSIPADRVTTCVWVWRFVCISCFVGMVNIPFVAMYVAKQEIAELTIYSIAQTVLNVCMLYYMVSNDRPWLGFFAAWTCAVSSVPQMIMCMRAMLVFPECRFRLRNVNFCWRVKELGRFAMLRFIGACTIMIQTQGMSILTNKLLGPARNAAMTVGNSLSSHSETLAGALDTALSPAITNACGANDLRRMRSLCFYACKFGTLLMLLFALPLSLESGEVMRLWLKNPPDYAAALCVCMLICLVLEKICSGHWMAIFAIGRIGWYQLAMGGCGLLVLPIAWILMKSGADLIAVGAALIVGKIVACIIRLWFGRCIASLSIKKWLFNVFSPLLLVACVTLVVGATSVASMRPSFLRVVITTVGMEAVFIPLCWIFVLSIEERAFLLSRITTRFIK